MSDDTDADAGVGSDVGAEDEAGAASRDQRTRSFRGISRRLAAHYLTNVGGTLVGTDDPAAATRVEGDRWLAELSAATVNPAGSIELTEVTVVFTGDPDVLDDVIDAFAQKAMRAGG